MQGEKISYDINLKSFGLELITGLVSIGHQKFLEKRLVSNSFSGPVKMKFRKHTISEKDRPKNVGPFEPIQIQKMYLLQYQSKTSQNEMDVP
ncbi:hypothetical protein TNCV_3334731 [Trichonephila clavipes]|nr:hypothetical protein TNCV_3334731 [Trichonephila clavipes]